jgi:hypothetical protein
MIPGVRADFRGCLSSLDDGRKQLTIDVFEWIFTLHYRLCAGHGDYGRRPAKVMAKGFGTIRGVNRVLLGIVGHSLFREGCILRFWLKLLTETSVSVSNLAGD